MAQPLSPEVDSRVHSVSAGSSRRGDRGSATGRVEGPARGFTLVFWSRSPGRRLERAPSARRHYSSTSPAANAAYGVDQLRQRCRRRYLALSHGADGLALVFRSGRVVACQIYLSVSSLHLDHRRLTPLLHTHGPHARDCCRLLTRMSRWRDRSWQRRSQMNIDVSTPARQRSW